MAAMQAIRRAEKFPVHTVVTNQMPSSHAMQRSAAPVLPLPLGQTVHERGDVIAVAGATADRVYKVNSGTLRLVRMLADGRRHIAKFLFAGDYFGIAEGEEYSHSLEAVTNCSVTRYARRHFDAAMETDAATGRILFGQVCRLLEASNHMQLLLSRKTAAERIATFLLSFRQNNERQICLPMCRSDIADHLGLTLETVSRVISKFRQQRWISLLDATHIMLTAPDKLEALAAD